MENQKSADLGLKHHGIKPQIQKVIAKPSKAATARAVVAYRSHVGDVLRTIPRDRTVVLFNDHEIKNIAARAKCMIAGFHRLAVRLYRVHLEGTMEDVIFSLALDDRFNDMTVGAWRAMIDRMKIFMKEDDVAFVKHDVLADAHWEIFYNICRNSEKQVSWDQLLWIVANCFTSNGALFTQAINPLETDAVSHIVIGSHDQETWSKVQWKLFNVLKTLCPDAQVVDVDAD